MSQKIFYDIKPLIELLKNKNILLVCGNSFDNLEFADCIKALNPVRFSAFSPNPVYEDVCAGVDLFRSQKCDAILAIGGGSSMDVAKCIKLFSTMDPSTNYLKQEYKENPVTLAAIPTTAGTGSESTRHAVIYYQGEKQSISHTAIIPEYVCLIPSVLKDLPLYQKKCTLLDALCQAIESWWSVSSTDESKQYSKIALEKIRDHWKAYIEDGCPEAASEILIASNYSGQAINITATTAAHAMSYKITSLYKVPHGHAVAVCLPEVWNMILSDSSVCSDSRGKAYLKETLADFPISLDWFLQLLSDLHIEYPVSSCKEQDLDILTRSVNPVRLKNNPVLLDESTLRTMYERIIQ